MKMTWSNGNIFLYCLMQRLQCVSVCPCSITTFWNINPKNQIIQKIKSFEYFDYLSIWIFWICGAYCNKCQWEKIKWIKLFDFHWFFYLFLWKRLLTGTLLVRTGTVPYWPELFWSINPYWPEQFRSTNPYWPEPFKLMIPCARVKSHSNFGQTMLYIKWII